MTDQTDDRAPPVGVPAKTVFAVAFTLATITIMLAKLSGSIALRAPRSRAAAFMPSPCDHAAARRVLVETAAEVHPAVWFVVVAMLSFTVGVMVF